MSNVLDKSFIHRSYPKLAYGSMYKLLHFTLNVLNERFSHSKGILPLI